MFFIRLLNDLKDVEQRAIIWLFAFIYGMSLPIGSLFLKYAAMTQPHFLFIEDEFFVKTIFWSLTLFVVFCSLTKVYEFFFNAYRSKVFAFLACLGLEFCFIAVDNVWSTVIFFLVISTANVSQACAGFLYEGKKTLDEDIKKKIEDDDSIDDSEYQKAKQSALKALKNFSVNKINNIEYNLKKWMPVEPPLIKNKKTKQKNKEEIQEAPSIIEEFSQDKDILEDQFKIHWDKNSNSL